MMTAEPVAIVDWDPARPGYWHIVQPGVTRSVGVYFYTAVTAMHAAQQRERAALRWEPAGPHTFHGFAIDGEPYESELP